MKELGKNKPAGAHSIAVHGEKQPRNGSTRAKKAKARADQQLVQRCLAGKQEAWESLYLQCQPHLLSAIRFLLGEDPNQDVVDEIAARVWYALVRDNGRLLARYDPDRHSRLEAYLMGLARIEMLRYARSEHRRQSVEFIGGRQSLAESRVPDWEAMAMLREFESLLTPGEKEFIKKSLLAPDETEVPADAPILSASNIWQRRHRIKLKLKRFFSDH